MTMSKKTSEGRREECFQARGMVPDVSSRVRLRTSGEVPEEGWREIGVTGNLFYGLRGGGGWGT